MEFVISQILGVFVSIAAIISMQLKNVKSILVCQLICNALGAFSYIYVGGFSGCGIYFVALFQTVLYYYLRKREINTSNILTAFFVLAYLFCSITTYKGYEDVFSAVAAVTCALALSQNKAFMYRLFMLFNGCIWSVYDISVGAYTMIISHAVTALSAFVGMIRLDYKSRVGEYKND